MKLVGAKNTKIVLPFLFEGLIMGLVGGLIAIFIAYQGYEGFLGMSIFAVLPTEFILPQVILHQYLIYIPILSSIIGIISSFITVTRHTKV